VRRETTWVFLLAVGLWGCGGPSSAGVDAGAVDSGAAAQDAGRGDPFADAMRVAHNAVRARAMPVPSPALAPLSWSAAAASTAATWAEGCRFEHNPALGSAYGENLFAGSGTGWGPAEVVDSWESERRDYDLTANRCAAGKQCGHYTQLVWRASTGVGCALKACSTNSPFGSGPWTLVVCNYAPPGNFVGQRPY
jgi:pathogenesis-related protein 1